MIEWYSTGVLDKLTMLARRQPSPKPTSFFDPITTFDPTVTYGARGRVWKQGRTWYYEVTDRAGKIVFTDNTGSWRKVYDACRWDTSTADRVVGSGHHFEKSYPQLVAEAE